MHDSTLNGTALNGTAEYGTTRAASLAATPNAPRARIKTNSWRARAASVVTTIASATLIAATLSACAPSQAPQTMDVTAGGRTFT
ncbi:MAG: hypothetical protein RIR10_644, partial [Planctomycetota bacterium]